MRLAALALASLLLLPACASEPEAPAAPAEPEYPRISADWRTNARDHREQIGERFVYDCPANPDASHGTIWGGPVYSDDSAVCAAGVHAGVIAFAAGGPVTIEMRAGESEYVASEANGVSSSRWSTWPGSFVVIP